jgi:hypothetical protein
MKRIEVMGFFVIIFASVLILAGYIATLVQATIEKLTVWLVFGEIMTGVGLIYVEASAFFWNSQVWIFNGMAIRKSL